MFQMSRLDNVRRVESLPIGLNGESDFETPHITKLWGIHQTLAQLRGVMTKQEIHMDIPEVSEEILSEDPSVLPQTYIVIQLNPEISAKTLQWIIEKIKGRRRNGGGELIVFRQPYIKEEPIYLHVSASKIKFLECAEEMELVKMDIHGQMREFTVGELDDFLSEGMHVDDLLTTAEKQTIVRNELENIRALLEDHHVPGFNMVTLYEGQSILQVCMEANIVLKMYPLHEAETLKKLGRKWYLSVFRKQPFEEIRLYFGESIALYFTFLGYYTMALIVPVILGFLQLLLSIETVPFFCIFNVVWVTVFLEVWKRKSNELAFQWGTIGMTSLDLPRVNFRGPMSSDEVTGKLQPQYPRWKTNVKMYCVSLPISFLCTLGSFVIMLVSFWIEDGLKNIDSRWAAHTIHIPSIVYTGVVYVMNVYYRKLATFLTEWENHRTQSQYDRHRVTKLVLFEFVNNFMSLFYIAFIIQDMDMLRTQLATMLIILQAINNLQEAVLPFIWKFYVTKVTQLRKLFSFLSKLHSKNVDNRYMSTNDFKEEPLKNIPQLEIDDPRVNIAIREGDMEEYEGTYDDYLEMFIQFGYVILFSSVYPIAGFWAIFNNVLEIRADAFKLCMVYQRPMARRVKDIGAWQRWFSILGAISILTNCGLLFLSPQMRRKGSNFGQVEWVLIFVLLEHFLLALRYILHITIPDKPLWVRVALAKRNYESKQALKHERSQKCRRLLTRKFKTVHGSHAR
ncbi:anoctamin-10 isoform X1 [Onthophagus taurus]|uniref:anoctamin-10 isoform X1 n=2 Tax=Onthophagus taurus TaxID=166361 RepID=UPI0039BE76BF